MLRSTSLPEENGRFHATAEDGGAITALVKRLRSRLEGLASQQDGLAQAREQVLVDRSRFKSVGKGVRQQRDRVNQLEAALMDAFREHHNDSGKAPPTNLSAAYVAVEVARSELVLLEDDHNQIDESLGASEWALMDAENDLYQFDLQQLLSDESFEDFHEQNQTEKFSSLPTSNVITPSPKIQYQIAVAEYEECVKHYNDLRSKYNHVQETTDIKGEDQNADPVEVDEHSETFESYDKAITRLISCELRVRRLRLELAPEEGPVISQLGPRSDGGGAREARPGVIQAATRAHSDGTFRHIPKDLPTKHCVDHWLLESLKSSGMEKFRFKLHLQHELDRAHVTTFDDTNWEVYAVKLWPSSMVDILKWPGLATSITYSSPSVDSTFEIRSDFCSPEQGDDQTTPTIIAGDETASTGMQTALREPEMPPLAAQLPAPLLEVSNELVVSQDLPTRAKVSSPKFDKEPTPFSKAPNKSDEAPLREEPQEQSSATTALEVSNSMSEQCDRVRGLRMTKLSPLVSSSNDALVKNMYPSEATGQYVDHLLPVDTKGEQLTHVTSAIPPAPGMGYLSEWNCASSDLNQRSDLLCASERDIIECPDTQSGEGTCTSIDSVMPRSNQAPDDETSSKTPIGAPLRHSSLSDFGQDGRSTMVPPVRELQTQHSYVRLSRTLSESESRNSVLSRDMGFHRVPESRYHDFFTCGRIFSMLWGETARRKFSDLSQSSRESSPVGRNYAAKEQTRTFIVVKNRRSWSECLPVVVYQGRIHVAVGGHFQDLGEFLQPELPSENIQYSSYVRPSTHCVLPEARYGDFGAPMHAFGLTGPYTVDHTATVAEIGTLDQVKRALLLELARSEVYKGDISFQTWSANHTS